MKNRPRLKLELTTTDKVIEVLGWTVIIGTWVMIFYNYSSLPETIPTHYNAAGEVDGYGNKSHIIALPVVSTILFIGLFVLNKFPHIFNYPTTITEDNAHQLYTKTTRLIRFLNLAIAVVFGMIVFETIQTALGNSKGLGAWFLPVTLGIILIPLIFYLIQLSSNKKSTT